jgi:pyridoxine kinase
VHDAQSAVLAARALGAPVTFATSIPAGQHLLANVLVAREEAFKCVVERCPDVPHGSGDLIAALFAEQSFAGGRDVDILARATGMARCVIEASRGRDELDIIGSRKAWPAAAVPAVETL